MNLVRNAIKFTDHGNIIIEVSYGKDRRLKLSVQDTGVGIAETDLEKLFTRFGKLHRTADTNHEGIGLGLNIVKQIVESYNGDVSVHSKGLGKGSTFLVYLELDSVQKNNE